MFLIWYNFFANIWGNNFSLAKIWKIWCVADYFPALTLSLPIVIQFRSSIAGGNRRHFCIEVRLSARHRIPDAEQLNYTQPARFTNSECDDLHWQGLQVIGPELKLDLQTKSSFDISSSSLTTKMNFPFVSLISPYPCQLRIWDVYSRPERDRSHQA